jgi:uncharacterized membrane protein YbhN (UPF0104 family)
VTNRSKRRGVPRRILTVLGVTLAVAGSAFVIQRIAAGWAEYGDVVVGARWGWLLAALGLAVVGVASMGLVWRRVIAALGGQAGMGQVFVWYQLGNLGKYLPGGLWPLVGRSELAVRGGLPRAIAYNSVALSMAATYLCGAIVCALLLPFALATRVDLGTQIWAFALIPAGLALLHPAVLGRVFRFSESFLGKDTPIVVPRWSTSVSLVLRHGPPWLAMGVATWFVALTFAPDAPLTVITFAGILSWVAGFLVLFVPGGIGIREAVFTAIASVALAPHVAATVAVVSRLVFLAADAIGAAGAAAVAGRATRTR